MFRIHTVIIINILLIINFLIIFDWFSCVNVFYHVLYPNVPTYITGREENNLPFDKNKKSIITIGDSFTFGYSIGQEDTLSYKLQKSTNRKTYNKGYSGTGIQHVLYQLDKSNFFNSNGIEPEYIIYTFIGDHMRRMYVDYLAYNSNCKNLRYVVKDNKLTLLPLDVNFMDKIKVTILGKKFNNLLFSLKNNDEKFDLFKKHVLKCKEIINKKYSNTKFVIIVYNPNIDTHNHKPYYTNRWHELQKEGIIVIRFDEKEYNYLTTKNYIADDGYHPSGKAWDSLLPLIIKKLNL